MCDKLVFDLAQEVEGSPNVFVRKDWINILDNQNQNYSNNQSIIDTSQLSNSNKYMSYREAYLAVPLLMTIALPTSNFTMSRENTSRSVAVTSANQTLGKWSAETSPTSAGNIDNAIGLKNWFGQIIHSLTLDYNGTTICQQTPYINMWNSFKLMTSLSYQDLLSQGAVIGFYPDDATAFQFFPALAGGAAIGVDPVVGTDSLLQGTTNNTDYVNIQKVTGRANSYESGNGNNGYLHRKNLINYDSYAYMSHSSTYADGAVTSTYNNTFLANSKVSSLWKSYISRAIDGNLDIPLINADGTNVAFTFTTPPVLQTSILAIIKLKHLHSFFNMCPLLKGVFMKITLNLNNTSSTVVAAWSGAAGAIELSNLHVSSVSNAIGGVNPMMITSPATNNGGFGLGALSYTTTVAGSQAQAKYLTNISVGARCLDQTLVNVTGVSTGQLAQSVYLYVPAYTFNPPFEQALLSSPVKQINYTDVYQYQILNIPADGMINQLITNGIANIKSILILPYLSSSGNTSATCVRTNVANNTNTGFLQGVPVYQSPFDPAGTGPTSPLAHISNFNVQISGQNAIYNLQKYNFEQFNNQLYGQNAVNGGLTDGLTSGLVGRQEFDMSYCYYYINVERMLPVEMGVPKSVQVIGQNMSVKAMDYFVFVEYGVKISVDILTGARV